MTLHKQRVIPIVLAIILVVSTIIVFTHLVGEREEAGQQQALYYDSLATEYPNQTLNNMIISIFKKYGYKLKIYEGYKAGVEELKDMSIYDIVVIRAHGGYNNNKTTGKPLGSYVFTGTPYNPYMYFNDQKNNYLVPGVIPLPGGGYSQEYFVASPRFFAKYTMFKKDSIVILATCFGMNDDILAKTLLAKGVKVVISWNGSITAHHLDYTLPLIVEKTLDILSKSSDVEELKVLEKIIPPDPIAGARLQVACKE